jgi:hypothetical protein
MGVHLWLRSIRNSPRPKTGVQNSPRGFCASVAFSRQSQGETFPCAGRRAARARPRRWHEMESLVRVVKERVQLRASVILAEMGGEFISYFRPPPEWGGGQELGVDIEGRETGWSLPSFPRSAWERRLWTLCVRGIRRRVRGVACCVFVLTGRGAAGQGVPTRSVGTRKRGTRRGTLLSFAMTMTNAIARFERRERIERTGSKTKVRHTRVGDPYSGPKAAILWL